MMHLALTPSDLARSARAELEPMVAALRADALVQLVAHARRLLESDAEAMLSVARPHDAPMRTL